MNASASAPMPTQLVGRWCAAIASLLATLLAHGLLLLALPLLLIRPADDSAAAAKVQAKRPAPPKKPKRTQFVLVDPKLEDEKPDPDEAMAVAAHTRLARERSPAADLPKGAPRSEGRSPILPSLPSRPPSPSRTSKPLALQRLQQPQREPMRKPTPIKKPDSGRHPAKPDPNGTLEPLDPTKTQLVSPKPPPKEPIFKDLRQPSTAGTPTAQKKSLTKARLAGTRSMALLKARYPEYMAKVLKRWIQAIHRQQALTPPLYGRGSILVQISIEPNGSIGELKVLHAPEALLVERNFTVASIRDAAPFPPLTPKMAKDPLFKSVTFLHIFQ